MKVSTEGCIKQGPGVFEHHYYPEECLVNDFSPETMVSPETIVLKMCDPRGRPLSEFFREFVENVGSEPTESESLCERAGESGFLTSFSDESDAVKFDNCFSKEQIPLKWTDILLSHYVCSCRMGGRSLLVC